MIFCKEFVLFISCWVRQPLAVSMNSTTQLLSSGVFLQNIKKVFIFFSFWKFGPLKKKLSIFTTETFQNNYSRTVTAENRIQISFRFRFFNFCLYLRHIYESLYTRYQFGLCFLKGRKSFTLKMSIFNQLVWYCIGNKI